MATADSVKAKIQGLVASANAKTGKTHADLTTAVKALMAGFGQGGGGGSSGGFEITEGTITPANASQSVKIPWHKETLPLFYVVMRQDLDTYVTPDNPATEVVQGGIVQFTSGYARVSSSKTTQYLCLKMTATTSYTGYTGSTGDIGDHELLTADGLLAFSNSAAYKWQPDVTYKYYIFDKVVQ